MEQTNREVASAVERFASILFLSDPRKLRTRLERNGRRCRLNDSSLLGLAKDQKCEEKRRRSERQLRARLERKVAAKRPRSPVGGSERVSDASLQLKLLPIFSFYAGIGSLLELRWMVESNFLQFCNEVLIDVDADTLSVLFEMLTSSGSSQQPLPSLDFDAFWSALLWLAKLNYGSSKGDEGRSLRAELSQRLVLRYGRSLSPDPILQVLCEPGVSASLHSRANTLRSVFNHLVDGSEQGGIGVANFLDFADSFGVLKLVPTNAALRVFQTSSRTKLSHTATLNFSQFFESLGRLALVAFPPKSKEVRSRLLASFFNEFGRESSSGVHADMLRAAARRVMLGTSAEQRYEKVVTLDSAKPRDSFKGNNSPKLPKLRSHGTGHAAACRRDVRTQLNAFRTAAAVDGKGLMFTDASRQRGIARGENWVKVGGCHVPMRRARLLGNRSECEEAAVRGELERERLVRIRAASRQLKARVRRKRNGGLQATEQRRQKREALCKRSGQMLSDPSIRQEGRPLTRLSSAVAKVGAAENAGSRSQARLEHARSWDSRPLASCSTLATLYGSNRDTEKKILNGRGQRLSAASLDSEGPEYNELVKISGESVGCRVGESLRTNGRRLPPGPVHGGKAQALTGEATAGSLVTCDKELDAMVSELRDGLHRVEHLDDSESGIPVFGGVYPADSPRSVRSPITMTEQGNTTADVGRIVPMTMTASNFRTVHTVSLSPKGIARIDNAAIGCATGAEEGPTPSSTAVSRASSPTRSEAQWRWPTTGAVGSREERLLSVRSRGSSRGREANFCRVQAEFLGPDSWELVQPTQSCSPTPNSGSRPPSQSRDLGVWHASLPLEKGSRMGGRGSRLSSRQSVRSPSNTPVPPGSASSQKRVTWSRELTQFADPAEFGKPLRDVQRKRSILKR